MEICLLGFLILGFHLRLLQAAEIFQHQQSSPSEARTSKTKEWMPSSSPILGSDFTWVSTPDLDKADPKGSEAAIAFLYSGDVLNLSQVNCTQRFELRALGKDSGPSPASRSYLRSATDTLTHATNFLNMVFQTNDIRESSMKEDIEWYHALVRSVMEGDSQVYRAILTFDTHPLSSKPQMMLQATKGNNEILLQDLSAFSEKLRNLTWENEWYNFFRFQRTPLLYKRILNNDLKTLDTPKWSQGDSYVMDQGQVKWSPPFLECEDGKFLPTWMITLSSSFYGLRPDLGPEFKGVMKLDVKIQNVDINQCASDEGWFGNTHQCDLNSTQCVTQENQGFVLGKYLCICKPGFYGEQKAATSSSQPSSISQVWSGESASQYGAMDSGNLLLCQPCQEGCIDCVNGTPCLIQEDWSLRAAVLAFQVFSMLAVFFSTLILYHCRKSKRIRASGVILLETILFGSLLLYCPVFILYFKPSIFCCIALRWVRMLGFAIVYGTITLKLYRVLKVFLSHTAQRLPYLTSGQVLKKLALILLLVLWFLAAWTVGMLENLEKNIPLVVRSQTPRGLQFYICDHDRWDYMTVVAEMLFLFWGSFLCYATRTVPSPFREPRYMAVALHNELITSTAFHVIRFSLVPSLHPDWTLLLFFIHTHLTTTMTLALIFIPKFLHAGSSLQEEIAAELYEEELDMRCSRSYLNSSITSGWSEHSLDPDDIRDELKKLYTQLEVHKTKKMIANNPHLQKKRSSKRGLGCSLMRRITEIPESMSHQCSKEEKDGPIAGGKQNRSGSYKLKHLDSRSLSMKLKEDFSLKHRVATSLKKSHSTCDYMREVKRNTVIIRHDSCKEAPLLDSLMRKKLATKTSQRSYNNSVESVSLVHKSVSAHDLLAGKKPLRSKPPLLQKSLSVASNAKEKAMLLTISNYLENNQNLVEEKDTRAAVENSTTECEASGYTEDSDVASKIVVKLLQIEDTEKEIKRHLLEDGSSSKNAMGPWEVVTAPSTLLESRAERHVMYTPFRSTSVNTYDLPGRRLHAIKKAPPEPPIRQQSLIHNLERQGIGPWDACDKTQHPAQSPRKESKDSPLLVSLCPEETKEASPLKTEVEKSMQAGKKVPPSSPALIRLASIAAEACPWEVMEMPIPSKKDLEVSESDDQKSSPEKHLQSLIPQRSMKSLGMAIKAFNQSTIKRSLSAEKDREESEVKNEKSMGGKNEKTQLAETALMSTEGSPRQQVISRSPVESRAKLIKKQAAVCPWDEEKKFLPNSQSSLNRAVQVCPWEMNQDKQGRVSNLEAPASNSAEENSPIRLEKTKSQWVSLCPWETTEEHNRENKTSNILLTVSKTEKKTDTYPKEMADATSIIESDIKSQKISSIFPQDEPIKKDKRLRKEMFKSSDFSKDYQKNPRCIDNSEMELSPSEIAEECSSELASHPLEQIKRGPSKDVISKASYPPKTPMDNMWHDSVSPLKIAELEDVLRKISVKSLDLSNRGSEMSESFQNKIGEIYPWETQDIEPNLKTSTWENNDTSASKIELRENISAVFREEKKETRAIAPVKGNNEKRESTCPWDCKDNKNVFITPTSKNPSLSIASLEKSESMENQKTTVCPRETEDMGVATTAELCPWKTISIPSDKRSSSQVTDMATERNVDIVTKPPGQASSSEETSNPWETLDTNELSSEPSVENLDLSIVGSKISGSSESLLAEVCPWESEDCQKSIILNETDPSKIIGKVSSLQESVCPWDSVDHSILSKIPSKKSNSTESLKTEVCPWELTKDNVFKMDCGSKTLEGVGSRSIFPVSLSKVTEKLSNLQEDICPWENSKSEQLSVRSGDQSPALSKTGSKKSNSIQSLRIEVCPWENSEEVGKCPWKASMASLKKRKIKQVPLVACKEKEGKSLESPTSKKALVEIAFKKTEKSKSHQEFICQWGSMNTDKPAAKSTQSLDILQVSSKKSKSVESLKAEVCPWEFQELQTDAKIETDPSTLVKGVPDGSTLSKEKDLVSNDKQGTTPVTRQIKRQEELSSPQTSICPLESMKQLSSQSSELPTDSSIKLVNAEGLRAEVCPWETEEEESSCKTEMKTAPTSGSEEILRKSIRGVSKDKTLPSSKLKKVWVETASKMIKSQGHQALVFSQKTIDKLTVKPSSRSLDLTKAGSMKLDNAESLKAEVCPWEMQEAGATTEVEACPWEVVGAPLEKGTSNKIRGCASKGNEKPSSESPTKTQEAQKKTSNSQKSNCLLESIDVAGVRVTGTSSEKSNGTNTKAEICSQEISQSEATDVEICPWEVGTENHQQPV